MKQKENVYDTYIIECSGREVYANCYIVGIDPKLEVSQGYDGGFAPWEANKFPFTKEEKAEIADYMIGLWNQWKNK